MYCTNCGKEVLPTANFCAECGTKVLRPEEREPPSVSDVYAGFWWRTLALSVDGVIMNVAGFVIAFIGGVGHAARAVGI